METHYIEKKLGDGTEFIDCKRSLDEMINTLYGFSSINVFYKYEVTECGSARVTAFIEEGDKFLDMLKYVYGILMTFKKYYPSHFQHIKGDLGTDKLGDVFARII